MSSISCLPSLISRLLSPVSCPYSHLLSCLTGQLAWRHAALRICGQLAAGSAYFRLLTAVWDLGLSPIHVGRSYWMAYGRCASWLEVANRQELEPAVCWLRYHSASLTWTGRRWSRCWKNWVRDTSRIVQDNLGWLKGFLFDLLHTVDGLLSILGD